jgi:hypothetical protein
VSGNAEPDDLRAAAGAVGTAVGHCDWAFGAELMRRLDLAIAPFRDATSVKRKAPLARALLRKAAVPWTSPVLTA